ncbi:uncharacterized protein SPAPADRAFT_61259 [Spathaspora passalidarum NRRL Y-27907]|uniref:Uncharacterized protein n=1 Tax=Spathaspora passalidarum (strain NRRL Y-27907 / 11-Y1) TaxID=619300 RepID=G3APJ7_SPAPN|nr:uncharacterized protein SPAPADRAFT_61259 [Spathaspora passalidarum NRRL Y-27907]EGW32168.1 hypothetical protein SPAPADRAFT_61259 [Spathaspora passalidarum NRRL Y-27907]
MIPSPTSDKLLLSEHQFYAKSSTQPPKSSICHMFNDLRSFDLSDLFEVENIFRLLIVLVISVTLYKFIRSYFRRRTISKERSKPITPV